MTSSTQGIELRFKSEPTIYAIPFVKSVLDIAKRTTPGFDRWAKRGKERVPAANVIFPDYPERGLQASEEVCSTSVRTGFVGHDQRIPELRERQTFFGPTLAIPDDASDADIKVLESIHKSKMAIIPAAEAGACKVLRDLVFEHLPEPMKGAFLDKNEYPNVAKMLDDVTKRYGDMPEEDDHALQAQLLVHLPDSEDPDVFIGRLDGIYRKLGSITMEEYPVSRQIELLLCTLDSDPMNLSLFTCAKKSVASILPKPPHVPGIPSQSYIPKK